MAMLPDKCDAEKFVELARSFPVVDVRSPGEFNHGHVEGAINIPLFDNDERALIGTLYVNAGKDKAIKQGMELAGRKFSGLIADLERAVTGKSLLVHCWRGGMRSESMAWFFRQLGYEPIVLQGGYKAYRRFIRTAFENPSSLMLLGGMTGSGKTEILQLISQKGNQVIDLELLANHKGSVFGHLGMMDQPTTEQFENTLFYRWDQVDHAKPLFLEHESNRIGTVFLPDTFYRAMLNGTLILMDIPVKERVLRLVREYAHFDNSLLQVSLERIRMEMGTLRTKDAIKALQESDFEKVAELTLQYYDKAYAHALETRPVKRIIPIKLTTGDARENAGIIIEMLKTRRIL